MKNGSLHVRWRNLFSRGHDDNLLEAAGDGNAAIINSRDIAGIKPPVIGYHRTRGLWIFPVAEHYVGPSNQQGIIFTKLDFHSRNRPTYAAGEVVSKPVAGNNGTAFGHSISLQDR